MKPIISSLFQYNYNSPPIVPHAMPNFNYQQRPQPIKKAQRSEPLFNQKKNRDPLYKKDTSFNDEQGFLVDSIT